MKVWSSIVMARAAPWATHKVRTAPVGREHRPDIPSCPAGSRGMMLGVVVMSLFTALAQTGTDFGDAPDPYPTKLSHQGAWHPIGGPRFGAVVDGETDGQPDAAAMGDDLTPVGAPDDEDGITFLTPLVPGQVATVQIVVGGTGFQRAYVDAWIDFGGDGSWTQTQDQILAGLQLAPGTYLREFIVPREARLGPTYARFRISSQPIGTFRDKATDGEVEDYQVTIASGSQDFGDAPGKYPTLLSVNGARHVPLPGFRLGTHLDLESDGQPNADATGDDLNPAGVPDDEDGVFFLTPLVPGQSATVRVVLTAPQNPNGGPGTGRLSAWIDFNRNETWVDPGEQIFTNRLITAGTNGLVFQVPVGAALGSSFARFRLNREGALSFDGPATDGEVEDYQVTLER